MRLINRAPTARRRERGSQILEMALVTPLLLFIALMVIEGGGMIRQHQILNNAAREGAHFAIFPENQGQTAAIQQAVVTYAANNGVTITAGEVTVNQAVPMQLPSGVWTMTSRVVVAHPYTFRYLPRLPGFRVANTVNVTGWAQFRNFY